MLHAWDPVGRRLHAPVALSVPLHSVDLALVSTRLLTAAYPAYTAHRAGAAAAAQSATHSVAQSVAHSLTPVLIIVTVDARIQVVDVVGRCALADCALGPLLAAETGSIATAAGVGPFSSAAAAAAAAAASAPSVGVPSQGLVAVSCHAPAHALASLAASALAEVRLSPSGLPLAVMSSGTVYCYSPALAAWERVIGDATRLGFLHSSAAVGQAFSGGHGLPPSGQAVSVASLAALPAAAMPTRASPLHALAAPFSGPVSASALVAYPTAVHPASASLAAVLETQMASAHSVGCGADWRRYAMSYVVELARAVDVDASSAAKLRSFLWGMLGPALATTAGLAPPAAVGDAGATAGAGDGEAAAAVAQPWVPTVAGGDKHRLLSEDLLPTLIATLGSVVAQIAARTAKAGGGAGGTGETVPASARLQHQVQGALDGVRAVIKRRTEQAARDRRASTEGFWGGGPLQAQGQRPRTSVAGGAAFGSMAD